MWKISLLSLVERKESIFLHFTCFSKRSVLFEGHVTRYFVSLRNVCSKSRVRCSREDLLSRCEITLRKKIFYLNSKVRLINVTTIIKLTRKPLPEITCCCILEELSTSSQIKLINLELEKKDQDLTWISVTFFFVGKKISKIMTKSFFW